MREPWKRVWLGAAVLAFLAVSPREAAPQAPVAGLTDPAAVRAIPPLQRPPAGSAYTDPVFGTRVRRVSGLSARACTAQGCPFEAPTYSQLQAFNADGTLMLLTSSDGYRIRRLSDLKEVRVFQGFRRQAPRWHPTRPHLLVHFDQDDDADVTLQQTHVITNKTTDLYTFRNYTALVRDPSFDELSRDGRWLAGLALRRDGRPEVFAFDLARRRVGLALPLDRLCGSQAAVEPDWLAPSPLGRYLVIQWKRDGTSRCSGLEAYDLKTGRFAGRIVLTHPHGDLGVASGGREFFFTSATHPDDVNATGLAWYLLPGTATSAEPHYVRLLDWKTLMSHVSCQGPPGVCLVTSTSDPGASCCRPGWQPFQGEVWLQDVEGGARPNYAPVRRLAHHRSAEQGYWAQPHATLSRDGRYALFGSDWGIDPGRERVDPYLIELGAPARATASARVAGGKAYVTNDSSGDVSVLDLATGKQIGRIAVGDRPSFVAIAPNGKRAYVTNHESATVSVIRTADNKVVATVRLPGTMGAEAVAVTPDGSKVYVGNFLSHNVSVIRSASNRVVATIRLLPASKGPTAGLAIARDGRTAYIANFDSSTVSVIRTTDNRVVATVSGLASPIGLAITPDASTVYVANSADNSLAVIRASDNSIVTRVPLNATGPFGVAITPDGGKVYVSNYYSNTVSVISTAENRVVGTVAVGVNPFGMAVTPDGSRVYVVNQGSDNVSVIDTATDAVIGAPIAVGKKPVGIAIAPRRGGPRAP